LFFSLSGFKALKRKGFYSSASKQKGRASRGPERAA
jgi:hypothetical protein